MIKIQTEVPSMVAMATGPVHENGRLDISITSIQCLTVKGEPLK